LKVYQTDRCFALAWVTWRTLRLMCTGLGVQAEVVARGGFGSAGALLAWLEDRNAALGAPPHATAHTHTRSSARIWHACARVRAGSAGGMGGECLCRGMRVTDSN
jgi:cellulase/cellobiase CelA1